MKKVKLADIAREANVSVATVSYVLNNNPNQKINEKTKIKILQIASLLGYTKNSFASALANGKSNHIGIYLSTYNFPLKNSEELIFFSRLAETLKLNGYESVVLSSGYSKPVNYIDAIICIGLSDENFKTISNSNVVPVIAVDTKAHVDWIYEIKNSIVNIKEKLLLEDYTLITYELYSKQIMKEIKEHNKNVYFISSFTQLNNLMNNLKNEHIVVCGYELYHYLKNFNYSIDLYPVDINTKISKIIECLKDSIDKAKKPVHTYNY